MSIQHLDRIWPIASETEKFSGLVESTVDKVLITIIFKNKALKIYLGIVHQSHKDYKGWALDLKNINN